MISRCGISVVEAPEDDAVSLDTLKAYLVIDDDRDDASLTITLNAAIGRYQEICNVRLVTQTLKATYDRFPSTDAFRSRWGTFSLVDNTVQPVQAGQIVLPTGPVQSVESIKYLDQDGDEQTWDDAEYRVDVSGMPARIVPVSLSSWPAALTTAGSVRVEFVAGFGDPADIPAQVVQSILQAAAYAWQSRGAFDPNVYDAVLRMGDTGIGVWVP